MGNTPRWLVTHIETYTCFLVLLIPYETLQDWDLQKSYLEFNKSAKAFGSRSRRVDF